MKHTIKASLLCLLMFGRAATGLATTPEPATDELAGAKLFNHCKKLPAGKRVLKLTLKPDSEIADVIAWFSSVSCAQFIFPGQSFLQGRKVTILATQLLTPEEAYRLLLGALESVNLKVEPDGSFLRIVPTSSRNGGDARQR